MSLKIKHEDENDITNNVNIVSLGNEQIKSILKIQSEATFQDKNISNKSNFVKKSLIDIALDFESKQEKKKTLPSELESASSTEISVNEIQTKQNDTIDEIDKKESFESSKATTSSIESTDKKELLSDDHVKSDLDADKDNNFQDITNNQGSTQDDYNKDSVNHELDDGNNINIDDKSEYTKDEVSSNDPLENNKKETQQALNSVRDAVSQSINKSDNETTQTNENIDPISDEVKETIIKDIEGFKGIFSSLSSMSEKAIYDVMENKIIDIANELAGYQIDKMPEKYEKKIKAFLKNINCFEEKITIEVNDKDLEALSKIEDFKNISPKSQFLPNKDILRGDIILNCDGMYYSEKTLKKN